MKIFNIFYSLIIITLLSNIGSANQFYGFENLIVGNINGQSNWVSSAGKVTDTVNHTGNNSLLFNTTGYPYAYNFIPNSTNGTVTFYLRSSGKTIWGGVCYNPIGDISIVDTCMYNRSRAIALAGDGHIETMAGFLPIDTTWNIDTWYNLTFSYNETMFTAIWVDGIEKTNNLGIVYTTLTIPNSYIFVTKGQAAFTSPIYADNINYIDNFPSTPTNLTAETGNFWINYTWSPGANNSAYNISINNNWTNGSSLTYLNTTLCPHCWGNISVYGYNGTFDALGGFISANTQIPNNNGSITNISNLTIQAGTNISVFPIYSDIDNDTVTWGINITNGTFYTNNGTLIWNTSILDDGIHNILLTANDGYGSIISTEFTIAILTFPPTPILNTVNYGNFWKNISWSPGSGYITDSYNISRNDTWYNGTTNLYLNSTTIAHGYINDTIYAYNTSNDVLSLIPLTNNFQIPNNPVEIYNVSSSYILYAGQSLDIYPTYVHNDTDPVIFDRNFTQGTFNTSTGETHWSTTLPDIGNYSFYINISDINGSIDTVYFTVQVLNLIPINLTPAKITKKTINWIWENPSSLFYQCTEIYIDGIYQTCDTSTSKYITGLTANTGYTISLRVKDTLNNFYSFVNNTSITLITTDSPIITSSYSQNWFSPVLSQNFPITINYNSSLVPIQSISIEIRTKDENAYVRTFTSGTYTFDPLIINTSKIVNWNGKADNFQIVPDAYYIAQVTVTDYDDNTNIYTNSSNIGVDTTFPSSLMAVSKSRLFQSYYYKSNYSSPDPLRVNIAYYYGDYNTSTYITSNPITGSSTLSNIVIRKNGYILTTADTHTFTINKDADGDAWMWVDGIQVYNSNAGLTSTGIVLGAGLHEISIEYSKGNTNSPITLIPQIDAAELIYVSPISGDILSLFANDFNGSGINQIKYSIDDGLSYQTYITPINITGAITIYVCSTDNVSNSETCKGYTPSFTLPEIPTLPPMNETPPPANTPIPSPSPLPSPANTPPPIPPTPTNNTNNTFNQTPTPPSQLPSSNGTWNRSWYTPGFTNYIYNYFDQSIYQANNGSVDYTLYVKQYNVNFDTKVETTNNNGTVIDTFNTYAYPHAFELTTYKTRSLKGEPFGFVRADIYKKLSIDPWYEWLTMAYAVYSPYITINTSNYNLNDTIVYNININAWNNNDSSTLEIQNVTVLLYSPANPFTGDSPLLIQNNSIGTITQSGGNYTFNYSTNLYTDLVGTYIIEVYIPTVGGIISRAYSNVGYGSISPSDYTVIKDEQYANKTISGTIHYQDVNNITYLLQGARIYLNSTLRATTDINGFYSFNTATSYPFILIVNKTLAYNTETVIVNSSINNATLLFSKPFISTPYLNNNYIEGVYSHNFKTLNLWENPNYVFGIYTLNNNVYYKQCLYSINNIFKCDIIPNQNYEFHFMFSDIYNSNLTYYHQTLTGARNFTSQSLYMTNVSIVTPDQLSKNPQRDSILKTYFFTYLTILIGIILLIGLLSLYEKEDIEEIYIIK